jgi:hypothetical protein
MGIMGFIRDMRFIIPILPIIHRVPMNHFIVKIKYQARFPGIRISEGMGSGELF